ncbi:MAG TPA: hypothetical protein VFR76_06410 [Verrucomicrobiae bacterium]|nr:hypothetical protein [Verrucomicrobiae bacterium]
MSPTYIELIRKANLRSLEGEIWNPDGCQLCLILKDNMHALLACKVRAAAESNRQNLPISQSRGGE